MEPNCLDELYITATIARDDRVFRDYYYCQAHANQLGIDLLLKQYPVGSGRFEREAYTSCRLYAVLYVYKAEQYVLILREKKGDSVFACETGYLEAAAISNLAKRSDKDYRGTHDLIQTLLESVGASPTSMTVYDYDRNLNKHVSKITIESDGQTVEVGCRPSDLIALSLVYDMDVNIDKELLGRLH